MSRVHILDLRTTGTVPEHLHRMPLAKVRYSRLVLTPVNHQSFDMKCHHGLNSMASSTLSTSVTVIVHSRVLYFEHCKVRAVKEPDATPPTSPGLRGELPPRDPMNSKH